MVRRSDPAEVIESVEAELAARRQPRPPRLAKRRGVPVVLIPIMESRQEVDAALERLGVQQCAPAWPDTDAQGILIGAVVPVEEA